MIDAAKGKHTLKRLLPADFDTKKKQKIKAEAPIFDGASDCIIDGFLSTSYLKISFLGLLIFGLLF